MSLRTIAAALALLLAAGTAQAQINVTPKPGGGSGTGMKTDGSNATAAALAAIASAASNTFSAAQSMPALAITGTAGAGFIDLVDNASPSDPGISHIRLYKSGGSSALNIMTAGANISSLAFGASSLRTYTFPDVTGAIITTGDTGTVTNTMLAGSIANAKLVNASTTVNGTTCTLGSTCTPGALALGILKTTAVSNPSSTTSTSGVMMGLSHQLCAGSTDCSITPTKSGKVVFVVSGNIRNSLGGASGGTNIDLYYGTGTAPTNGTAPSSAGTTRTDCTQNGSNAMGANEGYPVTLTCIATGLVVGTAYWVDAALIVVTGGTGSMFRASVSAYEIY